jgi:hypothetical protein
VLVNNGVRVGGGPSRFFGAPLALAVERQKWGESGARRNFARGCSYGYLVSIPSAASHPSAWLLPNKSGAMACFTGCNGSSGASLTIDMGKDLAGEAAGTGAALDAQMSLVVPLAGTAAGEGGTLALVITGTIGLAGEASGISTAVMPLSLIVDIGGTAPGTGGGTAVINCFAHMEGSTEVASEALTAEQVAQAVWDALLGASTAGDLLQGAGASGNPWLASLDGYNADQAGGVIKLIQRILQNKQITDPATGKIYVLADDGVTPLLQANLFEDAAGSKPYAGAGAERRDRLE